MINFTCPNCHQENAYLDWSDESSALYICPDCDFEWEEVDESLLEESEELQNLKLILTEKLKEFLNEVVNNSDLKNESNDATGFAREYLFHTKFHNEEMFSQGMLLSVTNKKENTFRRIDIQNSRIELTKGHFDEDPEIGEIETLCIPPKIIRDSVDYSKQIDNFLTDLKEDLSKPGDMDIDYFR